jgi:hypothetical protein
MSGRLYAFLSFPGVIIHEWAHKKFCNWSGVPVYKVVYFSFGNPAGYVIHAQPQKYGQTFWISVGPLIINSLLTIGLSYLSTKIEFGTLSYYLLLWVALSIGLHAFPSNQDAKNVFAESKRVLRRGGSILHLFAYPFYGLILLANRLRCLWFDLFYAIILLAIGGYII